MTDDVLRNATPEAALARMLDGVHALGAETVALSAAAGRTLAVPVIAQRDQPPFDASAMDGYAFNSRDQSKALRIVGEAAAGAPALARLQSGEAARIFTGAIVPTGADAVAIQEECRRVGDMVEAPVTPVGQHIRRAGCDFAAGKTLLQPGEKLDAVAIALAASAGAAALTMTKRPRVVILSGGDELVDPGDVPAPHQIYESVSFGLAALVEAWGGQALRMAPRGDDIDQLAVVLGAALANADLVVTVGGASVGDHDLMKPALARHGARMQVDKSNVRPGKPVWFAHTPSAPVLGLPGNPASALVCAHLFLLPLLRRLCGAPDTDDRFMAVLGGAVDANGPRTHFLRARLSIAADARIIATPFERQDSSLLSVFHGADALVKLGPKDHPQLGDLVEARRLTRLRS
jgi:molybdopterin molybdotransferase